MAWIKIYGRRSRALGDAPDLDVVAHQIEPLVRLATAEGFPPAPEDIIAEIGSGDSIAQRPRFAALLAELETKPPRGDARLYVSEISRLSRAGMQEMGALVETFQQAGVLIRDRSRLYDLSVPNDLLFFSFIASIGHHERGKYSERIKMAYEKNLRNGKIRNGQAPWGYIWSKGEGNLLAVPAKFAVLQQCCADALTVSVYRLASRYSVAPSTLYQTLTNPAICGWPARCFARRADGSQYRLPRAEWVWPERENDTYPHACTRAQWEAIQRALADRYHRRAKTGETDGWCRDLVRFVDGPQECRLASSARKNGNPPLIYRAKHAADNRYYILRSVVHAAAYAELAAILGDPALLMVGLARSQEAQEREAAAVSDTGLADATQRLAALRRRYQEAVDREYDAQEPLRSALRERRLRLEGEVRQTDAELVLLQQQQRQDDSRGQALAALPELAADFATVWEGLPDAGRRALAHLLLASVDVRCVFAGRGKRAVREVIAVRRVEWFVTYPPVNGVGLPIAPESLGFRAG